MVTIKSTFVKSFKIHIESELFCVDFAKDTKKVIKKSKLANASRAVQILAEGKTQTAQINESNFTFFEKFVDYAFLYFDQVNILLQI